MKAKFHIIKKVTDMERPTKNTKEETEAIVSEGEEFGLHDGVYIFKLTNVRSNGAQIEYDRHYLVKNEHRGYEFNTILYLNETKQITSMWGRLQTTFTVTYLGVVTGGEEASADDDE
ncbi:MAG: hypothetical protein PHU47_01565 [Candidatus ainarchaeum sp.]|jgi:hypothetical protein|nr:hypothetical protein [Candidatus ainarchaeum sp.]